MRIPSILPAVMTLAFCGMATTASRTARAQTTEPGSAPAPAPLPPSPPAKTTTSWYGYQLIAADAAAGALLFWGGGNNGVGATTAASVGVTMYLTDSVAIHALHRNMRSAWISAALRVGAPVICTLLGAGIVAATSGSESDDEALPSWFGGAALGLTVGVLGAIVTDDVFLANEQEPVRTVTTQGGTGSPLFAIAPDVVVAPDRGRGGRATVGVVGTF